MRCSRGTANPSSDRRQQLCVRLVLILPPCLKGHAEVIGARADGRRVEPRGKECDPSIGGGRETRVVDRVCRHLVSWMTLQIPDIVICVSGGSWEEDAQYLS